MKDKFILWLDKKDANFPITQGKEYELIWMPDNKHVENIQTKKRCLYTIHILAKV